MTASRISNEDDLAIFLFSSLFVFRLIDLAHYMLENVIKQISTSMKIDLLWQYIESRTKPKESKMMEALPNRKRGGGKKIVRVHLSYQRSEHLGRKGGRKVKEEEGEDDK